MKEKINIKRRILTGILLSVLILSVYSIVHATISNSSTTTFSYGDGDTVGAWYPASLQASNIVYSIQDDRYYTIYPEYGTGTAQAFYSYSNEGNFSIWTEDGLMTDGYIVQSSHILDYPIGSCLGMDYSNISDKLYAIYLRTDGVLRVRFSHGDIGVGSVSWIGFVLNEEIACGYFNVVSDYDTGKPIVCLTGRNSTNANAVNTAVFFFDVINPISTGNITHIAICDSFGEGHRTSMFFPITPNRVYVIEGDCANTNSLRGGELNTSQTDFGVLTEITENEVKIWEDANGIRFMDWSLTYDDEYAYICYTDTSYDLYYFTIDINTLEKSTETLIINGTVSFHPFQPSICVSDYTPSIFYWNKTSSAGDMIGYAIELNESEIWDIENKIEIITKPWGTTNYVLATIMQQVYGDEISMIGYNGGGGNFAGTNYDFVGYGLAEEPEPFVETPDPFDWSNVKYILAFILFFIIAIFAIYVKHGGK